VTGFDVLGNPSSATTELATPVVGYAVQFNAFNGYNAADMRLASTHSSELFWQ
jgi:hypothetical protein